MKSAGQAIRQIGGRDLLILKWTLLRLVAAVFFLALSLVTAAASKSWHDVAIAAAAVRPGTRASTHSI